ncbi:hypothetical protein [Kitasatospora sp. NPDC086791]|uniref:hypothetical protein n=1 Tax=Kitasatospora sp. NPDC086791 TaxID=3155178 RepID=UPI003449F8F5
MTLVESAAGIVSGQGADGTQLPSVFDETANFPDSLGACGTYTGPAVGEHNPPAPAKRAASPLDDAPVLAPDPWTTNNGPLLALLADVLDDLERTRIANENRLRQLTRDAEDADGELRGFGLTTDVPQVAVVADLVDALGKLEHQASLSLQRAVRKHPLGPWVKATVGVGEKQGARLIAAIGDPYWNTLHDRPRLVSELWAYCGLHVLPAAGHVLHGTHEKLAGGGGKQGDPDHSRSGIHSTPAGVAPTRTRGQRANWSTAAKMRAYLVAESCIKQTRSPYRAVYDAGRAKYAEAVHEVECRQCGPSGNPARVGTAISAGHQHARAMRLVMKEILKDLWHESRRLHGAPDSPA